jgi:protein-tyrosine-phosphatase
MAEGLFRDAVKKRSDIEVSSAGVATSHGHRPVSTQWRSSARGVWIFQKIRSEPISEELVENATHIFAMTRGHLETIQGSFRGCGENVSPLRIRAFSPA